jgi:hypothetical protein
VLPALATLTARGAALGVAPSGGRAAWALVLHGDDAALLQDVLARALDAAARKAGHPKAFAEPHERVLGADVWRIGEELVLARRGALLVASNESGYGRDVLALAADGAAPAEAGLAGDARFRATRPARDGALVSAWLDLERVRELPPNPSGRGGGGDGLRELAELAARPAAQFLLGPDLAGLGGSDRLTARLEVRGDGLSLRLRGLGTPDLDVLRRRRGAARPPLPAATDDDVAVARLFRDFAAVFEHRAELFPPEVLPTLAKPLSDLAILFGGGDLSETVLPRVSPWITLVARRVAFDESARPEIALPALAGILRLEDAEDLGPRLTAAFQTLIGISNVQRAQQAKPPMVLGLVLEGETSVSRAAFLAPRPGEGVDVAYNLEPACATVGDLFVLGTHEVVVRQLVRELAGGRAGAATGPAETLHVRAPALAAVVERNFDAIVMNKVLEEGVGHGQAEQEIAGLRALLELLGGARIAVAHEGDVTTVAVDLDAGEGDESSRDPESLR